MKLCHSYFSVWFLCHRWMSIYHLVYSTHLYLKKSNVFGAISSQLHEVYSRWTTVVVIELLTILVIELLCGHWFSFLNYAHKTHKTKKIIKKSFSQIPMLSSKRGHVAKIMFKLGVHMTWLAVRIHFEVFFWEFGPDLLSYGLAFLKSGFTSSVTIKIFKPLK